MNSDSAWVDMKVLITGVAGFIGSHIAKRFLDDGYEVYGVDNLSRGSIDNISHLLNNSRFTFTKVDLTQIEEYGKVFKVFAHGSVSREVWHMAANSDIAGGNNDPIIDLRDTFLTTYNTLTLMREHKVHDIYFASSSAIYGDLGFSELSEDIGPLLPISNYGAMKLASEAAISAAFEAFLETAILFRFPNVVGVPATHGVIFDFINKLRDSPTKLEVLGNGSQRKIYLHVSDLLDAMFYIREHSSVGLGLFNIGPADEGVTVRFIAEEVVSAMSPTARIIYGDGDKGWAGDVPRFRYSIAKLQRLGWTPKKSSTDAIRRAVAEICIQMGVKR